MMKRRAFVSPWSRGLEVLLATAGLVCLGWCAVTWYQADAFQRRAARELEAQRQPAAAPVATRAAPAVKKTPAVHAPVAPHARAHASVRSHLHAATPKHAAALGRIEIPAARISAMIAEGDDDGTLGIAVGHLPGTALPGEPGRTVFAGHRDTFFRGLGKVRRGDRIDVTTADGRYGYRVVKTQVVQPEDVGVLHSGPSDGLVLITCYPFSYVGAAPLRYVVVAAAVPATKALPG